MNAIPTGAVVPLTRLFERVVAALPDSLEQRGAVLDDLQRAATLLFPPGSLVVTRVRDLVQTHAAHMVAQREFPFAAGAAPEGGRP